ncbi:hypothetical protein F2Q70_00029652 [Brassica cretica]|uniref:Uncharacterized protein n=1 Tax=Brassica cretica TaxID=69181 RepID=A0A8S9FCR8_BRACR|nr:hypothetical protein F2Q70_00029652 [Brassica cretica]
MRVSDLINQESKDWDASLLENYVNMDDIPLIRKSECQSWFKTNKVVQPVVQDISAEESQVISVGPNFGQYHKWAATKGMGLKRPEPVARTRAREGVVEIARIAQQETKISELPRRSRGRLTIKEEEETRKMTR